MTTKFKAVINEKLSSLHNNHAPLYIITYKSITTVFKMDECLDNTDFLFSLC